MSEQDQVNKAGGPDVITPKDHGDTLESYRALAIANLKRRGVENPTDEQVNKELLEINIGLRSGGYY